MGGVKQKTDKMGLFSKLRWMFKLLLSHQVRLRDKVPIVLLLLYILNPIDLIPLPILGFGILDDLVIFIILMHLVDRTLAKYYNKDINNIDPDHVVSGVEYEVEEDEQ